MKKGVTILTACMILLIAIFCGCTKTEKPGSESIIPDENEKAEQAYMDFLKGNSRVTVPDSEGNMNILGLDSGRYSLQEMKTAIAEFEDCESSIKYAFLDFGDDGIKELLVRFQGINPSTLSWTGIIRYEDTGLCLNYCFEDGYRTSAKLYSSGYLLQTGSIGAGASVSQLIGFDEKGHGKPVFLERNYFGTFAAEMIYDLIDEMEDMSKDFSFVFDYISEKSELQVREYVAGDSVKISVKGWNDNSKIRRGEEQLIDYFVSLGAQKISEEEMNELCAIQEYQAEEVSYKDWPDTAIDEPVTADFATQALLEKKGTYDEFIADDTEYRQEVAFTANSKVTDFRVLALSMGDVNEDGRVLFSAEEVYSQKELTPDKPLVVTMSFPGDTPSMGISYVDSAGKEYVYSVSLSGLDGSVLLGDVDIE